MLSYLLDLLTISGSHLIIDSNLEKSSLACHLVTLTAYDFFICNRFVVVLNGIVYMFLVQISVSVTSVFGAAGCSRGYSVSSSSGAVSRIALAVSFENSVRDGPLLSVMDNSQVSTTLFLPTSLKGESIVVALRPSAEGVEN